MRWAAYAGVSGALAGGVVVRALAGRPNFYSAAVYLAQSNANLMILTNFLFLCACILLLGLQRLLYGRLRPIEVEQLYEKAWVFVTETCLSMTIFRGSFGAWFMVMFFSLLSGKVWGWIGDGRVETLEQHLPTSPRLFHTRLAISLSISLMFAVYMLQYAIRTVLAQAKPDMMVMFGFEFAVLTILATSTAARYAINVVDLQIIRRQKISRLESLRQEREAALARSEGAEQSVDGTPPALPEESEIEVEGWENRGRWIFYLDLLTDFLKLVVYVTFFSVLLGFYGLPLHIMRDLFLSFRSFFKRLADYVKFRNATRDMNTRYPDATAEEIGRVEVCIVCRDEMRPFDLAEAGPDNGSNNLASRMRPKKLPCGHVLHFSCLRSWLERQQNCPTCRRPVLAPARNLTGQGAADAGNAGAGGAGDAAAAAAGDHGARNRARIFNIGPLRIGFGAGNNNLVNDLAQRIHGDNADRPNAPADGAAQTFGFGLGLGRRPNPREAPAPRSNSSESVQDQLDRIESSLRGQVRTLQLAREQLHNVRALQDELDRLRTHRTPQGAHLPRAASNPTGSHAPTAIINRPPHMRGQQTPMPSSPITLSAGHQPRQTPEQGNLPEGVTLPPGWSLLPLHRSEALNRPAWNGAPVPSPAPAPSAAQAGSMPANLRPGNPPTTSAPPGLPNPPIREENQLNSPTMRSLFNSSPLSSANALQSDTSSNIPVTGSPQWSFGARQNEGAAVNGNTPAQQQTGQQAPRVRFPGEVENSNSDSTTRSSGEASSRPGTHGQGVVPTENSDPTSRQAEDGTNKKATVRDLVDDVD